MYPGFEIEMVKRSFIISNVYAGNMIGPDIDDRIVDILFVIYQYGKRKSNS